MRDPSGFAKRVDQLDEEDKEHFRDVIEALSYCYAGGSTKALIIIDSDNGQIDTMTVNCDDMEAYDMASATTQWFEFVNTKDAPPKENFN
jgi:hypothetical protein